MSPSFRLARVVSVTSVALILGVVASDTSSGSPAGSGHGGTMTAGRPRGVGERPLAITGRVAIGLLLVAGLPLAAVDLTSLAQYAPYAAIGGFLAMRRPRNAIGWILIGIGWMFLGTSAAPWLDVAGLQAGTAGPLDVAWMWFSMWAGGASFLLYAALAVTFPSGRLPGGRWRWLSAAALLLGAIVVLIPGFLQPAAFSLDGVTMIRVPNPLGVLPLPAPELQATAQLIVTGVPIAILAGAVASLIARYRRVDGIVRLQIRWLAASVAFVVFAIIFGLTVYILSGETAGWAWLPALVAYPTVPIAVGVAITRYRLFEIDRIVSRTISYVAVSVLLFATFAVITLAIGSTVGDDALTVAVATLVVAALFDPLRIRVQRVVDRRFNRSRYDQERTAEAFAGRLRDEVDLGTLRRLLLTTADDTVRPTDASVWLRAGTESQR